MFTTSFIDNYFKNSLSSLTQQQLTERILSNNNLLQLSQNKTLTTLINKFHTDLDTISTDGSAILTSALSTSIAGVFYGLSRLYSKAPDFILYSWLFSQALKITNERINALTQDYNTLLKDQETQYSRTLNHDVNNINIIS